MTAVNCLVWPDHAALFTDSASNIGGQINWIGSKARLFPNFPAAVSVTGTAFGTIVADRYIGGTAASFDDLVVGMIDAIKLAMGDYPEDSQDGENDFLAVGWSQRANGFAAFQCAHAPGKEPVARPAGPLYLQPGTHDVIKALKAKGMDPANLPRMEREAAITQMLQTMQVQRDAAPPGCVIGGYQQVTILTLEGIVTRVAHTWPDRVTFCRDRPGGPLPGLGG